MKKTMVLSVMVTLLLSLIAIPVSAAGDNLITNGDFEGGNTAFYTDYHYEVTSYETKWIWNAGEYTIQTDAHEAHGYWDSFGDHTSGTGKMMVVNGNTNESGLPHTVSAPVVVWGQTVTVPVPVESYDLYAGQTWDIGEVLVKNDADSIYVKFVLTDEDAIAEGWRITEVHVDLEEDAGDFPQANGNPKPGKFAVSEAIGPVTETGWYDFDNLEETVVIAAHVKIELPELVDEFGNVTRPYDSESAWGEGTGFSGKNWATYMTYAPEDYGSYTLSFFARNTAPVGTTPIVPAQLQVKINGDVVGSTLVVDELGEWQEFTATWNAGFNTSAEIEIYDLCLLNAGNDFALDDISFTEN